MATLLQGIHQDRIMQDKSSSLSVTSNRSQAVKKPSRSPLQNHENAQQQSGLRNQRGQQQQRSRDNNEASAEASAKGPIALLQEFVQCSRDFPLPPSYSALQWHFSTRMATKAAVEHRAVVAFQLEGVPHHAAGSWQKSKKLAQRDAADRALGLFVGRWGEEALKVEQGKQAPQLNMSKDTDEVQLLRAFCLNEPNCGGAEPRWTANVEKDSYVAIVEIQLLGVPHQLAGARRDSMHEARTDTAKRALWYLQCPGFETEYEAEQISPEMASQKIPPPSENWIDGTSDEDAHEKTAVMCLQNRLQQQFCRQLQSGQSVCEWSYEADPEDEQWPPLFRATVHIPVVGETFVGSWARGQRGAQIKTIEQVTAFLDQYGSSLVHTK
mmetsp:Transcript_24648/g.44826  ORF Transcript_24648/g.44826 Transcript_24648/m.44826 type:complete len:382 (-) Transcript_24648:340-1485(-)